MKGDLTTFSRIKNFEFDSPRSGPVGAREELAESLLPGHPHEAVDSVFVAERGDNKF